MKTHILQLIAMTSALVSFPDRSKAQMPNLRTAANFVLFSSVGAIGNTGTSYITGNIGTDNGAITGFGPPTTLVGTIDSGNSVTTQCKADLQAAYNELFNTTVTNASHTPAYGSGETLFPGVYAIAAAGSVAGNLILDAGGNANAVFIFKFGGALTTGASTTVSLINNASACNVFWIAEGSISMAASTTMRGTLIANNGAVSMGADGILEGRLMSTAGAASFYQVSASQPCPSPLPIELYSFNGSCNGQNVVLEWTTGNERNNSYFTIERSATGSMWQVVGTLAGAVNSQSLLSYAFTDKISNGGAYLYRLKQTDVDGRFKYAKTISVKSCGYIETNQVSVFPNPTRGKFELQYRGNPAEIHSIDIFNLQGQKSFKTNESQMQFDLSGNGPGMYFMHIRTKSGLIKRQVVLTK